jgi:hypothetical protein
MPHVAPRRPRAPPLPRCPIDPVRGEAGAGHVDADDKHGGRGFLLFEQRAVAVAVANGRSGARAATSAINGADHDPRTRSKLRPQVAELDRCGPEIHTTGPVLDRRSPSRPGIAGFRRSMDLVSFTRSRGRVRVSAMQLCLEPTNHTQKIYTD